MWKEEEISQIDEINADVIMARSVARYIIIITLIATFILLAFNFYQSLEESRNFTNELINYKTRVVILQEENQILSSQLLTDVKGDSKNRIIRHGDTKKVLSEKLRLAKKEIKDLKEGPAYKPSLNVEKLRRRISNQLKEMWFYISQQVESLTHSPGKPNRTALHHMLKHFNEINQITQLDFDELISVNGARAARDSLAEKLSDKVQKRLYKLQHPSDCDSARKLVCSLNKSCGYGCQMHHILYCFIIAYYTSRTMILDSKDWVYTQKGWGEYFLPLSHSCVRAHKGVDWNFDHEKQQVVNLPIVDELLPRPNGMPLSVPTDLYRTIPLFHGHPFVWWIGQFCKYIFKFQPRLKDEILTRSRRLGFRKPIVGIHVRRTDKINYEAQSHTAQEYMYWVEHYFKKISRKQKIDERRVYVSTDDLTVVHYLKHNYPEYTFINDYNASKHASVHKRFSDDSLHGVISDIELLSNTDYLICTFSSQFGRLAYEIMNSKHTDASRRFHSLDDIYYFGGQQEHKMKAIWPHKGKEKSEISFDIGDTIGIMGNHWDGQAKGKHHKTGKSGLFPAYKMEDMHDLAEFPTFGDKE